MSAGVQSAYPNSGEAARGSTARRGRPARCGNWLIVVLFLIWTLSSVAAASDRVLIAASVAPLADFVHQIGGDRVEVFTLVPPGASPHTYEIGPYVNSPAYAGYALRRALRRCNFIRGNFARLGSPLRPA
jgi:hypothetical protein